MLALPIATVAVAASTGLALATPASARAATPSPILTSSTTDCPTYAAGNANPLSEVDYWNRGGSTITNIAPAAFLYYAEVTASGGGQVTVSQSPEVGATGPAYFPISSVTVYRLSMSGSRFVCTATNVGTITRSGGDATVRFRSGLAAGTFIIGIRYAASSLIRQGSPGSGIPSPTYTFHATLNGTTIPGDQQLALAFLPAVTTLLYGGAPSPTRLADQTPTVGDIVADQATLHWITATAGGKVNYRYYTAVTPFEAWEACEADTQAFPGTAPTGGTNLGTRAVTPGAAVVPFSDFAILHRAGTYFWAAFYSGDARNSAAASDCTSEVVTPGKMIPSVTTTLSPASLTAAGGPVADTAVLGSATPDAGGSVDYRYYSGATAAAECDTARTDYLGSPTALPTGGTDVGSVPVTDGSVPGSASVSFPAVTTGTTFYWAAFYTGDTNNERAVSDCERLAQTGP